MAFNGTSLMAALKWPGAVVGAAVGLAVIASAFGFGVETPGEKIETFQAEHAVEHEVINDTLVEIDAHLHEQQTLMEAVVRGECIENPKENLQRQGLIEKCRELGIER